MTSRVAELPRIADPVSEQEAVEERIRDLFRRDVYLPLARAFAPRTAGPILRNSIDDLIDAIERGQVQFNQGRFTGEFNAQISREIKKLGGLWSRSEAAWRIQLSELPMIVRTTIGLSETKFRKQLEQVDKRIAAIVPDEIADKLKVTDIFDRAIFKTDKSFRKVVAGVRVMPELSEKNRADLAERWTHSLKLPITDFLKHETVELRYMIRDWTMAGVRRDSKTVLKDIQDRYDVSIGKARFLARQETNLMVSELNRSRLLQAGLPEYYWRNVPGSPAHPVRTSHKSMGDRSNKGETFKWTDPPLYGTNKRWNHPKQDFNCRCFAQPVVRF